MVALPNSRPRRPPGRRGVALLTVAHDDEGPAHAIGAEIQSCIFLILKSSQLGVADSPAVGDDREPCKLQGGCMADIDPYKLIRGLINTWAAYGEPDGHSTSDRSPLADQGDALKAIVGISGIIHKAESDGLIDEATAQESARLILVIREYVLPFPEVFDSAYPARDLAKAEVEASIASVRKS